MNLSETPFTFRAVRAGSMPASNGASSLSSAALPDAVAASKTQKVSHHYFTGADGKRYRMWYQTTERPQSGAPRTFIHETTSENWKKIEAVISPHLNGSASFTSSLGHDGALKFSPIGAPLTSYLGNAEAASAFKDLEVHHASVPSSPSSCTPQSKSSSPKPRSTPSAKSVTPEKPIPRSIAPLVTALQSKTPLSDSQVLTSLERMDSTATVKKHNDRFLTLDEFLKGSSLFGHQIIVPLLIPQTTSTPLRALLVIGPQKPKRWLRKGNQRDVTFFGPAGRKLQPQEEAQIKAKLKQSRIHIDKFRTVEFQSNDSGGAILAFCAKGFNSGNIADPANAKGLSPTAFRRQFADRLIAQHSQKPPRATRRSSETSSPSPILLPRVRQQSRRTSDATASPSASPRQPSRLRQTHSFYSQDLQSPSSPSPGLGASDDDLSDAVPESEEESVTLFDTTATAAAAYCELCDSAECTCASLYSRS